MAKKLYPEESVRAIADAIRSKNGEHSTYKINDMADALNRIVMFVGDQSESPQEGMTQFTCSSLYGDEYIEELCDKADDCEVYLNGVKLPYHEVYSQSGYKAVTFMDSDSEETVTCAVQAVSYPSYSMFQVAAIFVGSSLPDSVEISVKGINVSNSVEVEALNITQNGTYSASKGYAYSPINVSVPTGIFPSGTSNITSNGIYDITNFGSVNVNVPYGVEDEIITRSISNIYENNRITSIGPYAFYSCQNLRTVKFSSVTNIGSNAFQNCSELETVSFPSAKYIRNSAFENCNILTVASFSSVTNIGNNAFRSCSALKTVSFPSTTYIGTGAFQNCNTLKTISFPLVTNIGSDAFQNCGALTTVNFPSAKSIFSYEFEGCNALTIASFQSVTYIGNGAFVSCAALTIASFPSVTYIGTGAFISCAALTVANFPSATYIGSDTFCFCRSLTTAIFPNITILESGAFRECNALTTVNFSSATSIGYNAFSNCTALTEINLPLVTTIAVSAFYNCSALTTVKLSSITSIKEFAFENCNALMEIYLLASSVTILSNIQVFRNTPMIDSSYTGSFGSIYVPASLVDSYKVASNWSYYADRITAYEGE